LVWQHTWIIGLLAGIRVILTALTAFGLMKLMGLEGIALADTIAISVIALALVYLANRRLGNTFLGSGVSFLKIGLSAICAGGASAILSQILTGRELVAFLVAGTAGSVIYLLVSWIIQSDQLRTLVGLLDPHSSKGAPL
jgi:peptidoglycan biosynthesis protein MviN/MurJ (putative lipid II flippase)